MIFVYMRLVYTDRGALIWRIQKSEDVHICRPDDLN